MARGQVTTMDVMMLILGILVLIGSFPFLQAKKQMAAQQMRVESSQAQHGLMAMLDHEVTLDTGETHRISDLLALYYCAPAGKQTEIRDKIEKDIDTTHSTIGKPGHDYLFYAASGADIVCTASATLTGSPDSCKVLRGQDPDHKKLCTEYILQASYDISLPSDCASGGAKVYYMTWSAKNPLSTNCT